MSKQRTLSLIFENEEAEQQFLELLEHVFHIDIIDSESSEPQEDAYGSGLLYHVTPGIICIKQEEE